MIDEHLLPGPVIRIDMFFQDLWYENRIYFVLNATEAEEGNYSIDYSCMFCRCFHLFCVVIGGGGLYNEQKSASLCQILVFTSYL